MIFVLKYFSWIYSDLNVGFVVYSYELSTSGQYSVHICYTPCVSEFITPVLANAVSVFSDRLRMFFSI